MNTQNFSTVKEVAEFMKANNRKFIEDWEGRALEEGPASRRQTKKAELVRTLRAFAPN